MEYLVIALILLGWVASLAMMDRAGRAKEELIRRLVQDSLKPREVTAHDVMTWAKERNKWVATQEEVITALVANGWVVLSGEAWQSLAQVLEKLRQPTVQEWMDRD